MKKRILTVLCILLMPFVIYAQSDDALSYKIPFGKHQIDPTIPNHGGHRAPVKAPDVFLCDHVIRFETPCDGCTLQLLNDEGSVIYSIVITSEESTLTLPNELEGYYELQIIFDNWIFYSDIKL